MEDDCIFCKIVRGEIPSEKVLENDDFIVIKDANPKTEGHSLAIPKVHYENFRDMPSELYGKFLGTAKEAIEKLGADNSNMVINNGEFSGRLVSHIHMHILPRKEGDGFSLGV
jgi:histidine triad (HIT) family protein